MASETVFLPCQFCNKMIELKNVDTHQDECQTKHNHLSNDGNNDITIPCEFCEIAIDLNGLMCHQIVCRKKLKNTKNRVPNITEKTESSVYSKNMLLSSETVYYQDEFNQNSSERNTKKSVQDSSCNLNLNSPSTSKNYAVPTLILRKPKLTNDCSCSSPLSSKQSMALPVKYNSDINSAGVINTKNKMHNDRSPFLNSYRRDFQSDSTNKNVSYSEHNLLIVIHRF